MLYIDGLVQERYKSIANALELHLSCTNLSICAPHMAFLCYIDNVWSISFESSPFLFNCVDPVTAQWCPNNILILWINTLLE